MSAYQEHRFPCLNMFILFFELLYVVVAEFVGVLRVCLPAQGKVITCGGLAKIEASRNLLQK